VIASTPSSRKRILLVRDRDFIIHVHQLAELLAAHGHTLEILHTSNGEPEPLYAALIADLKRLHVVFHHIKELTSGLEKRLVALAATLGLVTRRGVISPHKIRAARVALTGREPYDLVIACDPAALDLASLLFPRRLGTIVDFSLEVGDESHPYFQANRVERAFRYRERALLPKIGALMIQDRFRAQVLLRHLAHPEQVKTIDFPVVMNGPAVPRRRQPPPCRVLFFGGLWSEELLHELESAAERLGDGQVLVIHGGRGNVRAPRATNKLVVSTRAIPFEEVNDFIATADIGLALYPVEEENNRCSAFASEKVARYLQCGIPFIAFESPDYAYLRAETGCCELVRTYDEIPQAVNTILADYGRYQRGAETAFQRFHNREVSKQALLRYIDAVPQGTS